MSTVDFKAISQAIATRFSAANVTPPAGETNVQLSTEALPDTITNEPTVLVFPPTVEWRYGSGTRPGMASFPVRFYLYQVRDTSRNADLMLDWMTALYAQLEGSVHLGLSSYVADSKITDVKAGAMDYAGVTYHGIEFTVDVRLSEALSPVA